MAALGRKYTVRTKKAGLYLREKPTKESKILRLIPNGESVTVDPSANTPLGWYAVKGGGYVMADFLEATEEARKVENTAPAEPIRNSEMEEEPVRRRGRRTRSDSYDD